MLKMMKKHVFFSLLFLAALPAFGQNVVRVAQIDADYSVPSVTFRVYWEGGIPDNNSHLDSVWLFVDYQPIASNGSPGAWTAATLTNPSATAPGTVVTGSLNGRGFYLRGTLDPSFSSTVTVTLAGPTPGERFNWCAYASDYPPNATEGAGHYVLHGTPPFIINGSTTEPTRQYAGCITSLTDATGCPGIVPPPTAITGFSVSASTLCAGESVTLEAAATGATHYSFNNGQSWISATTAATTTLVPTATGDYSVHVMNDAGCSATIAPLPVTVYPLPNVSFNNPPSTVCAGASVTLTVGSGSDEYCFTESCSACLHNPYSTGNDVSTEYDCIFASASCTFGPSNSYTINAPDSGNITVCVRVRSAYGCLDSACVTIGVVAPAAPVLSGGGSYCVNGALSCPGASGYSYQLLNSLLQNEGASQTGAAASLSFPVTATGAYTVIVTDPATGCTAASDPQAVTIHALPAMTNDNGTLTLSGTPPFVLSDAAGHSYTVPNNSHTVTAQAIIDAGIAPVFITDGTGCTGPLTFGTPVLQGSCTFTQPDVVNTFAAFPATYSASTFVSLMDERDLKIYTAVKIGGRWWMGQNLNYQEGLTYFDQHNKPNTSTGSNPALFGGFWCPADNLNATPVSVCDYWGALYPWETAMMLDGKGTWTEASGSYCTGAANSVNCKINHGRSADSGTAIDGRGICPPNWHVPTDFELGVLLDAMESNGGVVHQTTSANNDGTYVGANAGTRGKASCQGTSSDTNPIWDSGAGTDVFHFRALPADDRNGHGTNDGNRGRYALFWSSAVYDASYAWERDIRSGYASVRRLAFIRSSGNSIRCIRNE